MNSLHSPGPQSGSAFAGVLAFFGMIGAGLLAFFGARGSTAAQQQATLSAAFHDLTEDLQRERTALLARVSELEARSLHREGQIAGLRQYNDSLKRLLIASGLELPVTTHKENDDEIA